MDMVLTVIPFAGFYHSIHDDELDRACDSILQDDSGGCVHPALPRRLLDAVDWKMAHESYARQYAAEWCNRFGVTGAEFDELDCPREYNFTTDRIFVRLPAAEFSRIVASLAPETLAELAREWFTSQSGFMSLYSPDVADWGPAESWDHNQRGAAISALQRQAEGCEFDESAIVENWSGNGVIDNWVLNTPAAVRVANLAYRIRRMRGEC